MHFPKRSKVIQFSLGPSVSFLLLSLLLSTIVQAEEATWVELFDGKTLGHWVATNFGGEGNVEIDAGRIVLGFGSDLTGITWKGAVPRIDYEVKLEARREDGNDFFCGLTFPVNESFCSLILGGWGGTVVGLSSIDGLDASENETSRLMNFDHNRWYAIHLKVTRPRIEAWIDGSKIVDQELAGRKVGIRPEVELSRPFGVASWRTRAGLRRIALRQIATNTGG
jgi:Domain of Unknown Function (DUF1080)